MFESVDRDTSKQSTASLFLSVTFRTLVHEIIRVTMPTLKLIGHRLLLVRRLSFTRESSWVDRVFSIQVLV